MQRGYQPINDILNSTPPCDDDNTMSLDELIALINSLEVQPLTTHDRTLIKLALDKKSQEIGRLNSVELSILKR
jgi:hypothetical protein